MQVGKGKGLRRGRVGTKRRLVIAELDDRRVLGRPGGPVVFQVREPGGEWTDRALWSAWLVRDEIVTEWLEGRRDV